MKLNYLHAILRLRPHAQVAIVGGTGYSNIQWGTEIPIPVSELNVALAEAQAEQDKKDARNILKKERALAVADIKVTTSLGRTFDGDEDSQERMARAIMISQLTGITSTTWTLADNSVTTVTLAELSEALALAGQQQSVLWPIQE
jgi:hypothetical protein